MVLLLPVVLSIGGLAAGSGVVVEDLAPASAGERAGIRPGDLIVGWSRATAAAGGSSGAGRDRRIETPFDLLEVEGEEAPRGAVTLTGLRGEIPIEWTLPSAPFGLTVGPILPATDRSQPLVAAWLLSRAGKARAEARAWPAADAAYEEAVREAERSAAPRAASLLLRQWADTYERRSEWHRAEECYQRAIVHDEMVGAGRLAAGYSRHRLGTVAWRRGDLASAEEHYRRALALRESEIPGSLDVAKTLNNLGVVSHERGDLAAAEEYYRRALRIKEELAPGSADVATSVNNLGLIAEDRGDLDAAEQYHRRALAMWERLGPETLDVALSLNNLGNVARERGDLAAAEAYHRRSLAIREKSAPGSLEVASALNNVGTVLAARKDLVGAQDYHRQALAIKERLAPGSLDVAISLGNLAQVAGDRGDLEAAEDGHRRALAIREKLAPGSAYEAESLHELGLIERRRGRAGEASALLMRALDALDSQHTRLGGTEEVRSRFTARYAAFYHDALETLVELGRPAEALHVLERSRARSLLAMLAERDLVFSADLTPELARERSSVDSEYDGVQAALASLKPGEGEADIQSLQARLRELRQKQEDIAARVRRASPRLASLQYPHPLELAAVRRALDPGTVFLAYSVGTAGTVLFVVQDGTVPGPGLAVYSLAVGATALRSKVEAFREAIQRPDPEGRGALAGQAAELYALLIRPAESRIALGERLLLSPDGPLHYLPFGALVRRGAPKTAAYLIEWKPLHVVASATVYAELKKSRHRQPSSPGRLAAFGDPRYATPRSPLPFTRDEVEGIADLFPGRAETYLGEEATEERVKSLGTKVQYVHFACHSTLDERFPLNSALALAGAGRDNGLLQAWEIFDTVRIDADLVTLSGCKTALGKEMGGEGLLGLVRAFHHAGARSVLASLWAVSDKSTPLLMKRFYAHLQQGMTRDEALRRAQMDLIHAPASAKGPAADLAHPFRWAAFQLSGDWR
jgi:CHAT domain-containing protein/Tfp pilus assembly protein PilF